MAALYLALLTISLLVIPSLARPSASRPTAQVSQSLYVCPSPCMLDSNVTRTTLLIASRLLLLLPSHSLSVVQLSLRVKPAFVVIDQRQALAEKDLQQAQN